MITVNFNCPHCGNLMAVGTNLLGRNVRCPHCKQVVRAPATTGEAPVQPPPPTPAPPPMPGPSFNVPKPTEHHESIFGERHDEDVFGSEPEKPVMPPLPSSRPAPHYEETVQMPPPTPGPPPVPIQHQPEVAPYEPPAPAQDFGGFQAELNDQRTEEHVPPPEIEQDRPIYRSRPVRDENAGTPAFAWILLAYSALITIVAGFFAFQYFTGSQKEAHPYKAMPDVLRQYEPAKKSQVSFNGLPDPKLDIPDDLRVKLGDEITVGDLLVQPKSVTWQPMVATTKYVSDEDKTRRAGSSLVLTLRVKNLSNDTTFFPNDPAFQRAIDSSQAAAPYTALQIHRTYYYGAFRWPPDSGTQEEYFEGQEADRRPLKPGEERESYVTVLPTGIRSNVNTDIKRGIDSETNNDLGMLWRVQLRRGLVKMTMDNGQEEDISATCVIGVVFKRGDIKMQ